MAVGGNEIEGDRVGEEVIGLWVGAGESRTSPDGLLVVGSSGAGSFVGTGSCVVGNVLDGLLVVGSSGAGSVVGTGSCVVGTTGSFVGSLVGVPG